MEHILSLIDTAEKYEQELENRREEEDIRACGDVKSSEDESLDSDPGLGSEIESGASFESDASSEGGSGEDSDSLSSTYRRVSSSGSSFDLPSKPELQLSEALFQLLMMF